MQVWPETIHYLLGSVPMELTYPRPPRTGPPRLARPPRPGPYLNFAEVAATVEAFPAKKWLLRPSLLILSKY